MASIDPASSNDLVWNSGAFKFAITDSKATSSQQVEVHSAIEVASAIYAGEFERAVSYLGWILREADLPAIATEAGVNYSGFDDLLHKVTSDEALLPLSKEQRAVARMLYAVRVLGLDSEVHPSSRAIKVLSQFKDAFSRRPVSGTRRYNPVAAAASQLGSGYFRKHLSERSLQSLLLPTTP
jgi:hypothetical protein